MSANQKIYCNLIFLPNKISFIHSFVYNFCSFHSFSLFFTHFLSISFVFFHFLSFCFLCLIQNSCLSINFSLSFLFSLFSYQKLLKTFFTLFFTHFFRQNVSHCLSLFLSCSHSSVNRSINLVQ